MNREMFVRVATAVLARMGDPGAAQKAEAIAVQMDFFAQVMGDAAPAPPAAPPQVLPVRAAFPAPNPAAMEPALDPYAPTGMAVPAPQQQVPFTDFPQDPLPPPVAPLIVPATRIPDAAEIARAREPEPAPLRSIRPQGRMKVEELNQLIQDRTPPRLIFDVPMEDGTTRRMQFARNVISMSAFDSVKLVYYPPNVASQIARESVQVSVDLHVDDVPFDLPAIIKKLTEQAIESAQPRGAPRELPVRPFSGAVQSSAAYSDGTPASPTAAAYSEVGSALSTGAASEPAGYVRPELPSAFHPGQKVPPQ